MEKKPIEIHDNITMALERYSDTVRRICFLYLHNSTDVDDVFQEVFLTFLQKKPLFESDAHEKAWIIRVSINKCKDILKSFWRKKIDSAENMELAYKVNFEDKAENHILQVVLSLPDKYKDVIYLYYYEEYSVPEMAKLLKKNENTIYSHLHRARGLMKQKLGGIEDDYSF
jgi:RNA polymerase sigma-70 factor (ECF subfamily)